MRTDGIILASTLVLALGVLGGCNTVEGVGLDISATARTIGGWFGGGY